MAEISAINCIEVPEGHEDTAISIRQTYVDYFRKQPGFVRSIFYRSVTAANRINFINIVVWESQDAYDAVVNSGFTHAEGMNDDGMKVLGAGFPPPIKIEPGLFEVIG